MTAPQNQQPAPPPDYEYPKLPQYTASERPVTRGDRIAFQVWMIFFLLTIAFTLFQFLMAWLA